MQNLTLLGLNETIRQGRNSWLLHRCIPLIFDLNLTEKERLSREPGNPEDELEGDRDWNSSRMLKLVGL